jgi:pyridoxal phosphate enzyme (YggS family)
MSVAESLASVKKAIHAECLKHDRDPQAVKLVAVSKRQPEDRLAAAIAAGHRDFGENIAQELRRKVPLHANSDLQWHFIGHLQSNKIKYVVPHAVLIHSLDSLRLATAIEEWCARQQIDKVNVLLQLKTAKEDSKYGITAETFWQDKSAWKGLEIVRICGVMTMATLSRDSEEIRRCFRTASEFLAALTDAGIGNMERRELSMGMSSDWRLAIAEGATILRLGSTVFGPRNKVEE